MDYDVAVIGAGAAGYKAALTARALGARVALIEDRAVGGACLNRACIPHKALTHIARLLGTTQGFLGRGVQGSLIPDRAAATAFSEHLVGDVRRGLPQRLRALGITVLHGSGRLMGPQEIAVTRPDGLQRISAWRVILAVGSAPARLAPCPPDGRFVVDTDGFLTSLKEDAPRVLCVGGGAAGVEAAFVLRRFGSRVTLISRGPRLLNRACVSERAAGIVQRGLRDLGVDLRLMLTVAAASPRDHDIEVRFTDGSQAAFDRVVVAVGRVPRDRSLGLDALGVLRDGAGFVATNGACETSLPGVYAVGDMAGGPMTAAAAIHSGRIAGHNAVRGNARVRNYHQVPFVVETVWPLAAVGLSEDLAESAGFTPEVVTIPLGASLKARAHGATAGGGEIVFDGETGQMLGGCLVGAGADEGIHLVAAACRSRRGLWSFTDLDYGHPSWAEDLGLAIEPVVGAFAQAPRTPFMPGVYAPLT